MEWLENFLSHETLLLLLSVIIMIGIFIYAAYRSHEKHLKRMKEIDEIFDITNKPMR
jgi:preprotein translocase subunit YajC